VPVTYTLDRDLALVRTSCVGFVTFDEVTRHFDTLEKDSRRTGRLRVLLDLRSVTSSPTTGQLRTVAARIHPERSPLQFDACAVVAKDPVLVSMATMFTLFARERFRAARVLPTVEEAEDWLLRQPRPHWK
jgi:hypothetical protein